LGEKRELMGTQLLILPSYRFVFLLRAMAGRRKGAKSAFLPTEVHTLYKLGRNLGRKTPRGGYAAQRRRRRSEYGLVR
jgi:hypothetical protein